MSEFEDTLAALEAAKKRKKDLKRLMANLVEQYKLVKKEIAAHEKRVKALVKETELSGYLDTLKVDVIEFPKK